jgi:hypothetical protein
MRRISSGWCHNSRDGGLRSHHSEKHEFESIVKANHIKGNGFKSLVLELIVSKTFRTK